MGSGWGLGGRGTGSGWDRHNHDNKQCQHLALPLVLFLVLPVSQGNRQYQKKNKRQCTPCRAAAPIIACTSPGTPQEVHAMITNTRALQLPIGNSPTGNCNAHQLHSIALASWELPKRLMQCSPGGCAHGAGGWGGKILHFPMVMGVS